MPDEVQDVLLQVEPGPPRRRVRLGLAQGPVQLPLWHRVVVTPAGPLPLWLDVDDDSRVPSLCRGGRDLVRGSPRDGWAYTRTERTVGGGRFEGLVRVGILVGVVPHRVSAGARGTSQENVNREGPL